MKLKKDDRIFVETVRGNVAIGKPTLFHEVERLLSIIDDLNNRGVKHGSASGYSAGCRCDMCKAANSEYQKMYRNLK